MARICVIRQGYYSFDPRVRREVAALSAAGHTIDVLCLGQPEEPRWERQGRVTVHRIPLASRRRGHLRYVIQYGAFFVVAAVVTAALHLRRRFDLIQVNSMPDVLVFAAIVPRLLGARVLLDLQECMPEFYAAKFQAPLEHPAVKLLGWLEQAAIHFADITITCTDQMRAAFEARGANQDRLAVIVNATDEQVFDAVRYPAVQPRRDEFRLISHGSVERRYGIDTIVQAVAQLKDEIPGLRLDVFGEGDFLGELEQLITALGIGDRVYLPGRFVPIAELLQAIAAADAGVVAMQQDLYRDLTLCNKMFDFIAMRKPAIVSRSRAVDAYFGDSCFMLFTPGDAVDLARAIRELHASPRLQKRLVREAARVNESYRWPRQRERYEQIVETLLSSPSGRRAAAAAPGGLGRWR